MAEEAYHQLCVLLPTAVSHQVDRYNNALDMQVVIPPSARRRKLLTANKSAAAAAVALASASRKISIQLTLPSRAYNTREEFVDMLQRKLTDASDKAGLPGHFDVLLNQDDDIVFRNNRCQFQMLFKVSNKPGRRLVYPGSGELTNPCPVGMSVVCATYSLASGRSAACTHCWASTTRTRERPRSTWGRGPESPVRTSSLLLATPASTTAQRLRGCGGAVAGVDLSQLSRKQFEELGDAIMMRYDASSDGVMNFEEFYSFYTEFLTGPSKMLQLGVRLTGSDPRLRQRHGRRLMVACGVVGAGVDQEPVPERGGAAQEGGGRQGGH